MSYFKNIEWTTSFINNNINNNNISSQVLDPISSLIRLVLLIYKPKGTKLSFYNNKIYFQEPDLFQSTKRWTSGDNRTHIHNLYKPIFKINLWYDVSKPELIYILTKSQIGLKILLECYTDDNNSNLISHSINYYLETISNILNNNHNLNSIQKKNLNILHNNNIDNIDNNNINNNIDNLEHMENTTDIYSIKLKNLWNDNEINIIFLLLKEIDNKFNTNDKFNNYKSLIDSIENILNGKDIILYNIVNKLSTSL